MTTYRGDVTGDVVLTAASGIAAGSLIGIVAALIAAAATVLAAKQARKANSATVDVRIFKALQEDVVQLQTRSAEQRKATYDAQAETDAARAELRRATSRIDELTAIVVALVKLLRSAGLTVPPDADKLVEQVRLRDYFSCDTPPLWDPARGGAPPSPPGEGPGGGP